jgi:hypothetical protein
MDEDTRLLLATLCRPGLEFIIVGGFAAVLLGAPVVTRDLDIVHRRTPENVDLLLDVLIHLGAFYRLDLANRRLPPTRGALLGHGHLNLSTPHGPLDVLCELGQGESYEDLLPDTEPITIAGLSLRVLGLRRLIQVKAAAGRAKDRIVLPVLVATLEERERRSR